MKPKNDDRLDIELAEDEYEINRTQQALVLQAQIVQEALASLKAEQEKMKGQLDSMPKRLEETIDAFLKTLPQSVIGGPASNAGGVAGGLLGDNPPWWAKALGLSGGVEPNKAMMIDLQGQFEMMTAQLWKLQLRKMKDQLGIPEHIPVEGMHLNP